MRDRREEERGNIGAVDQKHMVSRFSGWVILCLGGHGTGTNLHRRSTQSMLGLCGHLYPPDDGDT